MSGLDVSTQDICSVVRDADELGEKDSVFFLYVATPGKPPNSLHRKVIEPFLREYGWQKVSYKSTGFRALYFLHLKEEPDNSFEGQQYQNDDEVTVLCSDDENENNDCEHRPKSNIDANQRNDSLCIQPTQNATNHRSELKKRIEQYKEQMGLSFNVHIVLSRPIDYTEDFVPLSDSQAFIEC